MPEASKISKGRAMVNLLQLEQDEKVTTIIPIAEGQEKTNLVMATKRGLIKKTALSEFESIRKVGKIAIKLVDDDELISVGLTGGEDEILIASNNGKCIRFSEKDVRLMGRVSQGVKSMDIGKNDLIVDMSVVDPESELITITEYGFGKRSSIAEYRLQTRGGKGVKAGNFNEQTGHLVALKQVSKDEDLMIIADNGVIIRTPIEEISLISRSTKGVKVMKLRDDAKIVSVALALKEDEEPETAEEMVVEQIQNNQEDDNLLE